MGKYAMLLVGALGLTGLLFTQASLNTSRMEAAEGVAAHGHQVVAREVALTGYNDAVAVLMDNVGAPALGSVTGRHGGGTYRADYEVTTGPPYEVRVRTVGEVEGVDGRPVRHVVEAVFRDEDGVVEETTDPQELLQRVPPYLRYAVYSDAPLRFLLLPRVLANGSGFNADVHTNGDLGLLLSLQAILGMRAVEGFGSYGGHLNHIALLADPEDAFRPNVNPAMDPTLFRAQVPLPPFDVRDLAPFATRVEPTTLRILGTTRLGTRERPEIIYVRGDLILVDTRFEGYGIFVVEGSVIHEGTVTGLLGMLFGQPESRVAFYANGPVLFNGVGDFQGQIFTNSSVTFSAATTLYGSIAARGAVNFLVAPTIRFTPPSPALTTHLPENPTDLPLRRVSFREWEVVAS
jgi:hypothetical protein